MHDARGKPLREPDLERWTRWVGKKQSSEKPGGGKFAVGRLYGVRGPEEPVTQADETVDYIIHLLLPRGNDSARRNVRKQHRESLGYGRMRQDGVAQHGIG